VQTLADADARTTDAGDATSSAPASDTPAGATSPADEAPASDGPAGEDPGDAGATPPAAAPPGSEALAGVVVMGAADGEGFVLATRDGGLLHVHASGCGVMLGDDLHLRARSLANGTWSADRVRRVATADVARVAGTVVWTDPATGRYALGARGTTVFVTVPQPASPAPAAPGAGVTPPAANQAAPAADGIPPAVGQTAPAAAPPATAPAVPALGARVLVRLTLEAAHDGQQARLVEQVRRDAPPPADPAASAPPLELTGSVQSVDVQQRTLVLALDPDAQPPLTVALSVPPQLDLARLLPAQRVAVTATATPDGTLALSGVSPDGDALAADDATALQGDQAPSEPSSGDAPATTVASCTSLDAPARAAGGLKTFTTPPRDRNER
ncbi:MAG TPA: hypothetical protein VFG31_06525, partial [Conexibacter sp.]|nr:hypothetical protein [Conexibacter sp.]